MGDTVHRASTVLLLAAVSTVSLFLKDLGLVVAFGGAILGSALVYIMPALMFLKHKHDDAQKGGHHLSGPSFTRGGQPSSGILGALRCCNRAGGPCKTHR